MPRGGPPRRSVWTWVLVGFVLLVLATAALGQAGYEDEGLDQIKRGPDPIQRISETWQQWRQVLVWIAAVLVARRRSEDCQSVSDLRFHQ